MKICSLCKSKYDDRVDFCFRDGTPLMPLDEPVQEQEAPDADLFNSATRPFVVQPEGPPQPVDSLDAPPAPDGDGLDAPEPRFGFDPSSLDAPEPQLIGTPPSAVDAPDPTAAPEPASFDATDVPAGPSFLDAPEPSSQLDAPEPAAFSAPEQAHDAPEPAQSHSETMVPSEDEPEEPAPAPDEEPVAAPEPEGDEDDLDASFAAMGEDEDEEPEVATPGFGADVYTPPPQSEPESSNRTLFYIMGAVAVIAVLVILYIMFLMPGDPVEPGPPEPPPVAQPVEPTPPPTPAPPPQPVEPPPEEPGDDQAVADILEMPTDEAGEQAPPADQQAVQPPKQQPPKQQPPKQQPPKQQPPKQQPEPDNGGQASPWGQAGNGGSSDDGGGRDIWGSGQSAAADSQGSLTIRSNPMGAMVFVGSEKVGRTPLEGKELPPGSHIVRVELDGYSTVSKVANIQAGQAADLGTVQLESQAPVSGYVTLWADNLIGAKVYIDNQYVGELPVKVELDEGKHAFFVQPAEGTAFTVNHDVHFDVQGIGISINLGSN
jgi:hypothetical protein